MEQYEVKTIGKMIDLCSGPDIDRWLPGTTKVDNNIDDEGLTEQEQQECVVENLTGGIPFGNNSVDQITCRYGCRYLWRSVKDMVILLSDAIRVLKPQGRIILQDVLYLMDSEWQEREVSYATLHSMLQNAMEDLVSEGVPITLESEAVTYDHREYVWIFYKDPDYDGPTAEDLAEYQGR